MSTCGSSGRSGGVRVFVDRAAQDGFSEDPFAVEVGHGDAGSAGFVIGDALGDALVRPGCVVVHLVFGQDGTQMALPGISTRSRGSRRSVPARRSHIAFIRGARTAVRKILVPVAWKTAPDEGSEVRSAIADHELDVREPLAEGEGEVTGLLHRPLASRVRGDAAKVHPPAAVPGEHQHVQAL